MFDLDTAISTLTCITCTPPVSTPSSSTGAPYLYHLHASCINTIIIYRCALPVSLARLLHQHHRLQVCHRYLYHLYILRAVV